MSATNTKEEVNIQIKATLPRHRSMRSMLPRYPFCSDDRLCGRSDENRKALEQAANIQLRMSGVGCTPEQARAISEILESLLRKHYGGK
jgi:hypothetical protein